MLRELQIRNLALIESLNLHLDHGFTCLTGETGAGKSILLDAVGLLLGVRASAQWVRTGTDKAIVEGAFDLSDEAIRDLSILFEKQGIDMVDDQIILSRELFSTGKTVARLNGHLVTVQLLRDIGHHILHQYGQHDSTLLLRKEEHISLLDRFAHEDIASYKDVYKTAYNAYRAAKQALLEAEQGEKERAQRIDQLDFQIKEIEQARVKLGEEEKLTVLRNRLHFAERLQSASEAVYQHVYEGSGRDKVSILAILYDLLHEVGQAQEYDQTLSELYEYLEVARVNLSEAAEFARKYREDIDFQPQRLQKVEDRLATLERLFRKYGENEERVLLYEKQAQEELTNLLHHDEWIERRRQDVDSSYEQLQIAAQELSQKRHNAAVRLKEALQKELLDLMMPNVTLCIDIQKVNFRSDGADDVEILLSANPGEVLKPLAKIASGGELSRIMLAFAQVLIADSPIDTMIFDEIDTGISGRAAQAVAQKLTKIASHMQVLCVTHLPQMASAAQHHLFIEKIIQDDRTRTVVHTLSKQERITELARMMNGENITEKAKANALEMLKQNHGDIFD